jgi:homoserine O-succinyltransferase
MFGVFEHRTLMPTERLLRGFDDTFLAPHSRHIEIRRADIEKVSEIQILSESDDAGVIVGSKDGRHIFVTGHSEYDPLTIKSEYDRDVNKGLPIHVPKNYYTALGHKLRFFRRWKAQFVTVGIISQRRSVANSMCALARTCQPALRQLVELLRLSGHTL